MAFILFKIDQKNIFKSFLENRNMVIEMLDRGEIDKREFLVQNYRLLTQISIIPKKDIASIEEGVYNYQYYNGMAKYHAMILSEQRNAGKSEKKLSELANKIENYYREKDKQTSALLEFVNYTGVDAYYIEMNSKRLEGTLFEINFYEFDKVIFHSKSEEIKENLIKNKVFSNEIKNSAIVDYVNTQY